MTKIISQYKFHLLIFIFSFLILTRFQIDPDLGWHLAIGNEFLQSGQILRADPFSWTMPNYLWGNSYFLYQIFVAFLFNNFGHIITFLIFGFLASLTVAVLTLHKKLNLEKSLVILLGAGIATVNLGTRPHTISFLMFSILLIFLERDFFKKYWHVLIWFLFFALWANLHRGFVLGALVLFGFLILKSLKKFKSKNLIWVLCIFASLLGTLITPFPLSIWQSGVIFDLASPVNLLNIAEWQPVVVYFPVNLLFGLSGLIFIYIFLKNFKKVDPIWIIIAALIFALPFLATNFVFYWVALFIFVTSRYFDFKIKLKRDLWAKIPIALSAFATMIAIVLSFSENLLKALDLKNLLVLNGYPVQAASYLKRESLTSSVFNEYSWGGYLDWQAPEMKVFIDGRMASWKKEDDTFILADYLDIKRGKCDLLSTYDIKVLLVKKNDKFSCFGNWQVVYEDSLASVLVGPN